LPAKIAAVFPPRGAIAAPRAATPQVPYEPTVRVEQPAPVQQPTPVAQRLPDPPARKSARDGNWGVQIGAYSDAAIGGQALSNLALTMPGMLEGGDPQVQSVSAGGVTMYRARMMGLDKKTAQNVCSYLIQRGKSCLTVSP
jgi:D-alanyl-D-alanine carboxypeptidase